MKDVVRQARWFFLIVLAGILAHTCTPPEESGAQVPENHLYPVAHSLDGTPLYPPPESESARIGKDSLLTIAREDYQSDPVKISHIIWYGRRLAYLSRYPEAIDVYSRGLRRYPDSPELLRHRGHRYITTREFDNAIADLHKAALLLRGMPMQVEQDGMPNAQNTPLSNIHFNVWYHLGLAYYLNGAFDLAAMAYDSCLRYSVNPDLLCATADWYYLTLMKLGKKDQATALLDHISPDLPVVENAGYLQRLLMYKGLGAPESLVRFDHITEENQLTVVTQGYGVANYFLHRGDRQRGNEILREIVKTRYWPAFGYIAAEADLFREKERKE